MNKLTTHPHLDQIAEPIPTFPIRIHQYDRMIATGVVEEDAPVFLWQGRLVTKMGSNRPQTLAVMRLMEALRTILPDGYYLEQEQRLDFLLSDSSPDLDVKVVRGALEDYPDRPPTTKDVAMVVEVADSSLKQDMLKGLEYAREKVPITWIVRIPERDVFIFNGPRPKGYRKQLVVKDQVPVVVDRRKVGSIAVDAIIR